MRLLMNDVVQTPIDQLIPYEKNAKLHPKKQVAQIAASIKEFGFNQPIVVDKDNKVIVGHGRLAAARLLGLETVPVVTVNLTDEQAKSYRLADNKLNESDWDMNLVIEELKSLSGPMVELTGFDTDLIIEPDEKDDEIPSIPEEPQSKLGDLYILGNHRVLCGDSTNLSDVEILMNENKADIVFTDPPYNVAYIGKTKDKLTIQNDAKTPESFRSFCEAFIKNYLTFCKGAMYVCMSSSEWGTVQSEFIKLGGHWSRVIIWVKDRMVLSRADYHTQFERIAVVNEDENEEGIPILYGWPDGSRRIWKGGRKQTDIWRVKRPSANKEHPTMKPVELCLRGITNSSEKGNIVLDLFLGSGSTLIASHKGERICYGMELDPRYVDVIVQRYVDYTGNTNIIKNGKNIVWQSTKKENTQN